MGHKSTLRTIWGANSSSAHSSRVQVRKYSCLRTQLCYRVDLPVEWGWVLNLPVQPISIWDRSSQLLTTPCWRLGFPKDMPPEVGKLIGNHPVLLISLQIWLLGALDPGRWICDKRLAHPGNAVLCGLSEQMPYSFEPPASPWAPLTFTAKLKHTRAPRGHT